LSSLRFKDKQVYILGGNHEKRGNGKSAIDFMREINKPNWHIITKPEIAEINGTQSYFLPYMSRPELGVSNDLDGCNMLLKGMTAGKYLFAHHAISDTFSNTGVSTNTFNEIILPKTELEKKFKKVIAGHIHKPQEDGNTIITGSVFNNEAGETEKFIWKLDVNTDQIEKIKLPGRGIYKIENPTIDKLKKIPVNSIVKVILTSRDINVEELKDSLKKFDAYLLLEQYPNERKKLHFDDSAMDFSIPSLLKMYSEEKKIDYNKLIRGMELISDK